MTRFYSRVFKGVVILLKWERPRKTMDRELGTMKLGYSVRTVKKTIHTLEAMVFSFYMFLFLPKRRFL